MIKRIDTILQKISPGLHAFLKKQFNRYKKKVNPTISREEFIRILTDELNIKSGDVLFIHSSMRRLYLDFPKTDLLPILKDLVGPEGTLIFPCWHFNSRAYEYIKEHEMVFSYKDSSSAMGKLSDVLRFDPEAIRSFHPTNSVIATGPLAADLVKDHASDIYPCGPSSPFYKMIEHGAKVIGIGVTVDNLTFVHVVEDLMREEFPIKTRMDEVFKCKCLDETGEERIVKTLVASERITHRDVTAFFDREISESDCTRVKIKGMNFFSLETPRIFERIRELALQNKTIYTD